MALENKKTLIIRIYQILERYSDEEHPLTQQDIIDLLNRDFGAECERKAVGRNLSFLKEAGFDIESGAKGSYLASRKFENSELRLLIDSVLGSKHINSAHSRLLIDKLIQLGGNNFKSHVGHVYAVQNLSKSKNMDFFLNIEIADEAIELGKKIKFDYYKIGEDNELHFSAAHTASPYQMLLHNQRYYLMLRDDKYGEISFDRMDKIKNMSILDEPLVPLKENKGFEHGLNYEALTSALPYMFSDAPQLIRLRMNNSMMSEMNDWFGENFSSKKDGAEHFIATLKASPKAMLYWVLQYNSKVEVLSPRSLRDEVIAALKAALELYKD